MIWSHFRFLQIYEVKIRIWSCRRLQICKDRAWCLDVWWVFSRTFHQWLPSPRVSPPVYQCTMYRGRRPGNVQSLYESECFFLLVILMKVYVFTCMPCSFENFSTYLYVIRSGKVLISYFMAQSSHFTVKTFRLDVAGVRQGFISPQICLLRGRIWMGYKYPV